MIYKEISKISSSFSVTLSKSESRMDPHYYYPEFVSTYSKLLKISKHEIRDFFAVSTGKSPPNSYSSDGIPFVRIQNLTPFGVELDDIVYVERTYISKSDIINPNDILITITGATIGKLSINQLDNGLSACSDIAILTPRDDLDENLIYYLYGVLQTSYMFKLFWKGVFGVSNGHLSPKYIKRLPIPLLSEDSPITIGKKLKESIKKKLEAKKKKEEIDTLFAKYLPQNFEVPTEISFVYKKSSCANERRNDPKTFSPRLVAYIQKLRGFGYKIGTLDPLKNGDIHRGIQPEYHANGSIPVIKTRDVNDSPIDWGSTSKTDINFYQKNKRAQIPQNALLVTSTGEGSWGRTSISDKSEAIADGHITIIPIDEALIDPYYVCAFLWTEYSKIQYYKRVRGCTGQTEIYPFDIKTIEVPRLENNIETKIGNDLRDYIQLSGVSKNYHQQAMSELEQLLSLKGGES